MNSSQNVRLRFELDRFETLMGEELYAYMEPIVCGSNAIVDADDLFKVAERLSTYCDEFHIVYAIEFGAEHNPALFAELLPPFLSHSKQAVRLATFRALERLPKHVVTTRLLEMVEKAMASCPESSQMQQLVDLIRTILAAQ